MDIFAPYEQAHRQEGQARQRMEEAERQLRDAANSLMAQRQGRLFLRWLVHQCQCFSAQNLANGDCGASGAKCWTILFTPLPIHCGGIELRCSAARSIRSSICIIRLFTNGGIPAFSNLSGKKP